MDATFCVRSAHSWPCRAGRGSPRPHRLGPPGGWAGSPLLSADQVLLRGVAAPRATARGASSSSDAACVPAEKRGRVACSASGPQGMSNWPLPPSHPLCPSCWASPWALRPEALCSIRRELTCQEWMVFLNLIVKCGYECLLFVYWP